MRAALLVPILSVLLPAQEESQETYGHSRHGETFDEGPRQAAYLMKGLSDQVHFPVEGLSELAQKFFDQGITQQHGFWHFEAERSFRQVALMHPDCAMAYWGMARANDEHAERAAGFLCAALQRSKNAPKREQMWIDAWAHYYQIDDKQREALQSGDDKRIEETTKEVVAKNEKREKKLLDKLDKKLLKDLGTIVFEYPDDIEAKAFLAVQNWLAYRWGAGVKIVSHTAVDALLDQVFAKAPRHPAHHYRIHLWDREDSRRALKSAAACGNSAMAIAHQWHMPGHVYAKLDRHDEAAWQQEASSRCDHAHMMRDRVMPFLIHNYGHNQEWLARSLSHRDRTEEALTIAKNLAALPRHPDYNRVDESGDIAYYARKRLVQICEDHDLWGKALELCEQGYFEVSDSIAAEVQRLGIKARALYRLGRSGEADAVAVEVEGLLAKARSNRAKAIDDAEAKAHADKKKASEALAAIAEAGREPTNSVQSVLDLQRELRGEKLLAAGDAKAAIAELQDVKGYPKLQLAKAHARAGDVDRAIEMLEKEVQARPNRKPTARALFELYKTRGDAKDDKRLGELLAMLRDYWDKPGTTTRLKAPDDDLPLFPEVEQDDLAASFPEDFGDRPPLAELGPRTWSPAENPGFDLPVGVTRELTMWQIRSRLQPGGKREPVGLWADKQGERRATLVVFYLGFGCLHCVEQLHALRPLHDAYREAGIDIVAIGSEGVSSMRSAHDDLGNAEKLPFPMLADPKLEAFKAWRCYDDFEGMSLHGTFLVDADGRIRWQDISYEPFMELDWLLTEGRRLLALPAKTEKT